MLVKPTVESEIYSIDGEHYEYRVELLCYGCGIVDEWDSATETANGVQLLTKEECRAAIEEIHQAVQEGRAAEYFRPDIVNNHKC